MIKNILDNRRTFCFTIVCSNLRASLQTFCRRGNFSGPVSKFYLAMLLSSIGLLKVCAAVTTFAELLYDGGHSLPRRKQNLRDINRGQLPVLFKPEIQLFRKRSKKSFHRRLTMATAIVLRKFLKQ